jgi:5-methylcytosine-specific restriction protein B
MQLGTCGICQPRTGQFDVHAAGRSTREASPFEAEISTTIEYEGERWGLVPSAGYVLLPPSGRAMHHREGCPAIRLQDRAQWRRLEDPDGLQWRRLIDSAPYGADKGRRRAGYARKAGLISAKGVSVILACEECVLRPRSS